MVDEDEDELVASSDAPALMKSVYEYECVEVEGADDCDDTIEFELRKNSRLQSRPKCMYLGWQTPWPPVYPPTT